MSVPIDKFHSRCDTANINRVANNTPREIARRAILRKIHRQSSAVRTENIEILLDKPKNIHTWLEAEAKTGFKSTLTGGGEHVPGDLSVWIWRKLLRESTNFQETDSTGMMENLCSNKRGIRRRLPDCLRGWKFAILSEATLTFHSDDSPIRHRTLGIICEENPLQVILIPRIEITPPPGVELSPAESWVGTEEFGEVEDLTMYDMYPVFFVLDGIEEHEAPDHDGRNSLQYVLGDWMGDGEISDSSEDEEGF
ncbi:unnamed protein product [Clonostachys chloroleuca]|uniref:Uncharacterized protein n=1 Tax=Clonostachys chloroleuca TaxID=1926264 RepID=A0AA35LW56_9HYPO|nr:unnamed protein product [Clonostachys chloroleuca]